jgi:predicted transcriptional regulator
MTVRHKIGPEPKCELALKLHEKGISHEGIAGRLGINPRSVSARLKQAKERRERMKTANQGEQHV